MEEGKRKLLGPAEIIALIAGLGIIVYLGLKSGNSGIVSRTETVKVHEKPRNVQKAPKVFKEEGPDESVETMLTELADHFSDKSQKTKSAKSVEKRLPRDEAKFYDNVKKKESLSDKVKSTADWLRLLRNSQKTYSKVKSILGKSAQKPSDKVDPDNVNNNLKSKSSEEAFYRNLSESFGISQDDIKSFGKHGKTAISDWAEYIQENQKKD